ARQLAQDAREPVDVRVIERGVHLVQEAERARPVVEDREEQRQPGERLLAAREERNRLEALAARLSDHLDPGLERVAALGRLHQTQLGAPALEEPREEALEVPVDLLEGLEEPLLRGPRHPAERLLEVAHRRSEVVVLGAQETEPLVELAILL